MEIQSRIAAVKTSEMRNCWQSPREAAAFRRKLLRWYDENKRKLAWRGERHAYKIWISEVMLQQTRVAVVEERYRRFLRRFPSVRSLARARLDAVLAEWSGLGYYRRARNLHSAAQRIEHTGTFPRNSEELRKLPGIGRYTAAAIASIAFGETIAAVDGNIERVLRRLLGRKVNDLWHVAENLLDRERPGDFNQAMMELGATVCLPNGAPDCGRCPVKNFCVSRGANARSLRKKEKRQQKRLAYLLTHTADSVLLMKRPAQARLLPGMWELPLASAGAKARFKLRHSITTTDYDVRVLVRAVKNRTLRAKGKWHRLNRLQRLPLTGLTQKILRLLLHSRKII